MSDNQNQHSPRVQVLDIYEQLAYRRATITNQAPRSIDALGRTFTLVGALLTFEVLWFGLATAASRVVYWLEESAIHGYMEDAHWVSRMVRNRDNPGVLKSVIESKVGGFWDEICCSSACKQNATRTLCLQRIRFAWTYPQIQTHTSCYSMSIEQTIHTQRSKELIGIKMSICMGIWKWSLPSHNLIECRALNFGRRTSSHAPIRSQHNTNIILILCDPEPHI